MKLGTALTTGAILLSLFGVAASLGLVVTSSYLHEAAAGIQSAVDSNSVAEELHVDLLDHNREQLLFNHTGLPEHARKRDEARIRLEHGLGQIEQHINSDAERILVSQVQEAVREYTTMRQEDAQTAAVADDGALAAYLRATGEVDKVAVLLRRLIDLNQMQARMLYARIDQQDTAANILGISIIVALIALVLALGFGVRVVVYRPLLALRNTVKRFGDGDRGARASTAGPVEISNIADVFNEMADKLERGRNDQLRFLAAVAHDLRNPLNAIKMSMELVAATPPSDFDEIKELAEIVRRQSGQLDRMVGDLLDRTRIEAGQFEIKPEETDLRQLVAQAVRLYQSTSEIHRFDTRLPEQPVLCRCDVARIGQVLNNLLSNAVKYSPHGGVVSVEISVTEGGKAAAISVSDEGMGIAPEEKERVFEPFQRSSATRQSIPGVGLGLAVSRRLVEAHGGRIRVDSVVGRGSKFTVELPLTGGAQLVVPSRVSATREVSTALH